jgi:E3 ubiquitin-protein ligase BRE1
MIWSMQAETSLYAELDKLSAAWEALDRQLKSKVFDLTVMEERLAKMGHDVCCLHSSNLSS